MGFSEADSSKCRRHPCVRQSPGVCSSCLREKLSKLSASSSFNRLKPNTIIVSHSSSISSSSPPYSSASSSFTAGHRRNGSAAYVSVGMVLNNNNNNGLKKSRSVSCANLSSRTKSRGTHDIVNDKLKTCVVNNEVAHEEVCPNLKKKNGFIKKLMNTTTNKIKTRGVLMHSKTMTERSLSSSSASAAPSFITTTIKHH